MTREEALKILKSWDGYMFLEREEGHVGYSYKKDVSQEAINVAIQILEQSEEGSQIYTNSVPTVESEDNAIQYTKGYQDGFLEGKKLAERPRGEWKVNNYGEHICPVCGHYALYDECQDNDYYEVQSNFCPECGADLRSSTV